MAKICNRCGMNLLDSEVCNCAGATNSGGSVRQSAGASQQNPADILAMLAHLGTIAGCLAGGSQLLSLGSAQSAPQQAAAAAMAAAYAVVPYCLARAIGEIARHARGQ
jgi:hypothetical protein